MASRSELSEPIPNYRWVVISVWLFSSVSFFMVLNTLGILLPAISADLDLSSGQQGLLGSVSHWGSIALAIPLSWWGSRFNAKKITTVTLILATGCLFLQSWAPVFGVLMLGRLALGISNIAQAPARALLTQQWFHPREVITVSVISNVLFGLVVGGGLAASPFILDALGDDWRLTLRAFGIFFVAITLIWVIFGKERITPEYLQRRVVGESGILKGALRYRDVWIGGFGFIGANMSFGAFLSFYPTFLLEAHDISLRVAGGILALDVVAGGVLGIAVSYYASSRHKEGLFLQILGLLMVGTNVGMLLSGNIPSLLILAFFNGVAWAFFPILVTVPFHQPGIRPRELAVAFAFTMMMTSLGTALGPLIIGFVQQATEDLRLALFVVSFASLSLCVAGSILRFGVQQPSEPSPKPVTGN